MDGQGRGEIPEPYRILSMLGSGGLGTVYKVENTRTGQPAVMKVGLPDLDHSARERFQREAKALAQLHHPNIPVLYDGGLFSDGRPFLVTEWVEGSVLSKLLSSGASFSVRDVLLLTRALASALACAHAQAILHLDVKPANILVPKRSGHEASFEDTKLLDFSVLEKLEAASGKTQAGMVVGTPYYMSPEQVRGEALSPAADIFSLGVVMYQMLSNRLPFEGEKAQDMFFALLSKVPEPLGTQIPPPVADLVRRCLGKDPATRPRSGAEMRDLIDTLLLRPEPHDVTLAAPPGQSAVPTPATAGHGEGPTLIRSLPVDRPSLALSRKAMTFVLLATAAVAIAIVVAVWGVKVNSLPPDHAPAGPIKPASEWWLVALGALLVVTGVGMGMAVRRYLASKHDHLSGAITTLLKGANTREALSTTLSLQVDEVIGKCRLMDEKFLGLTMALMVREYDSARKFDDRQKALMNAIAILDKLGPKLSPWYIRHEKLIASGVSLVGIVSGLATAALSVAKLVKGTP